MDNNENTNNDNELSLAQRLIKNKQNIVVENTNQIENNIERKIESSNDNLNNENINSKSEVADPVDINKTQNLENGNNFIVTITTFEHGREINNETFNAKDQKEVLDKVCKGFTDRLIVKRLLNSNMPNIEFKSTSTSSRIGKMQTVKEKITNIKNVAAISNNNMSQDVLTNKALELSSLTPSSDTTNLNFNIDDLPLEIKPILPTVEVYSKAYRENSTLINDLEIKKRRQDIMVRILATIFVITILLTMFHPNPVVKLCSFGTNFFYDNKPASILLYN